MVRSLNNAHQTVRTAHCTARSFLSMGEALHFNALPSNSDMAHPEAKICSDRYQRLNEARGRCKEVVIKCYGSKEKVTVGLKCKRATVKDSSEMHCRLKHKRGASSWILLLECCGNATWNGPKQGNKLERLLGRSSQTTVAPDGWSRNTLAPKKHTRHSLF